MLYPGYNDDDATVEPGEVALMWTSCDEGIALTGPNPVAIADHLEELAGKLRQLPEPMTVEACISAALDPVTWEPSLIGPRDGDKEAVTTVEGLAHCGDTRDVVNDPRRATCAECISVWNECAGGPRTLVPVRRWL